jgi:hypothetical protein
VIPRPEFATIPVAGVDDDTGRGSIDGGGGGCAAATIVSAAGATAGGVVEACSGVFASGDTESESKSDSDSGEVSSLCVCRVVDGSADGRVAMGCAMERGGGAGASAVDSNGESSMMRAAAAHIKK